MPVEVPAWPGGSTVVPSRSERTFGSDVSIWTFLPSTAMTYSSWGCGFVVGDTYSGRTYTMELAIGTMSVSPSRTSEPFVSSSEMSFDTVESAEISASALAGPVVP